MCYRQSMLNGAVRIGILTVIVYAIGASLSFIC